MSTGNCRQSAFPALGRRVALLLCATALLAGAAEHACSDPGVVPFYPGERLAYTLHWSGVQAGEATLEVLPVERINGRTAYPFVLKVKTAPWIDRFYLLRYRITAWSGTEMERSLLYTREERKKESEKSVTVYFDILNNTAQYISARKKKQPLKILPGTFDPLSIFYYTRYRLNEGVHTIERHITDGKNNFLWRVTVLKKETVQVNGRHYKAYVIEPGIQQIGKPPEKKGGAALRIWISADKWRLPLKIQTTALINRFTAELVSAEKGIPRRKGDDNL